MYIAGLIIATCMLHDPNHVDLPPSCHNIILSIPHLRCSIIIITGN